MMSPEVSSLQSAAGGVAILGLASRKRCKAARKDVELHP
jgi:hypothetical protein